MDRIKKLFRSAFGVSERATIKVASEQSEKVVQAYGREKHS